MQLSARKIIGLWPVYGVFSEIVSQYNLFKYSN